MPDEQREYDRNTVRYLPSFIAQAGLQVVRRENGFAVVRDDELRRSAGVSSPR
jgi:hypothetical protein